VVFEHTLAERVECLGHGVRTKRLGCLLVAEAVDAFVVLEQLRQVFGSPVSHSPLKLGWVPLRLLGFFLFLSRRVFDFIAVLIELFRLDLWDRLRRELLPLVIGELGRFQFVLQPDNCSDFADTPLN
jgi:hypothetical protein